MSIHTITVTALPNMDQDLPDEDYIDTVQFTVTCPENANCSVWYPCQRCENDEPHITEDEDEEGEYTRHGTHHQRIDGEWMTDSGRCAATATDSGSDAMQEAAEDAGYGTHQIDLNYWGDGIWECSRIIPPDEKERVEKRGQELYASHGGNTWDLETGYVRDYWRNKAGREEWTQRRTPPATPTSNQTAQPFATNFATLTPPKNYVTTKDTD